MRYTAIGKGSEAHVYGPFTIHQLTPYLQDGERDRLDQRMKYVIKLYKSESIFPESIEFWDKIRPYIRHGSIIIPLILRRVPIASIRDFSDFPKVSFGEVYMEVQEYGGEDFFNLLFEKKSPLILSFQQFLSVWDSVIYMLEDAATLITTKKMILTDIKMENMVIKNYRLRLIDVQINPEPVGIPPFRIVTPQIGIMPIQYLGSTWKTRGDGNIRQIYDKKSQKIYNDPNNKLYDILRFIHGNIDSYKDIYPKYSTNPHTQAERNREKFFFVIYPLFMMILILEKFGHIQYAPKDRAVFSNIIRFCLDILRKRGASPSPSFFEKMRRVAQ